MLVRIWMLELVIAIAFIGGGSLKHAHAGEAAGTVTGVIYWDRDGNHERDADEPGIPTNPLLASTDGEVPTLVGDQYGDGSYLMEAGPGTYRVGPGIATNFEHCAGAPLPSYNPFGSRDCVEAELPITSEPFTEPFDLEDGETLEIDLAVTTRDEMILLGRALYDGGNVPAGSVITATNNGIECGSTTVELQDSPGGGPGDWILRALGAEQRDGCFESGDTVLFDMDGVRAGEAWTYQRFSPVPTLDGEFGREGIVTVDISFLEQHAWFWADARFTPEGSMIAPGTPVRAIFPEGIVCGETRIGDVPSLAGEVSGFSRLLIRSASLQPGCGTHGAAFQVAIGDLVTYDVHWYPWMFQLFGSDASEYPLPTPGSPPPASPAYCEPIQVIPVDPGVPLSPPPSLSDITPQSPPRTAPDPWPQSPPSATVVIALQEQPLSPPPTSPPPTDLPLSPPQLSPPLSPPIGPQVCVPAASSGVLNPPDTGNAGLKHSGAQRPLDTDD
jgi:hypothetical protein